MIPSASTGQVHLRMLQYNTLRILHARRREEEAMKAKRSAEEESKRLLENQRRKGEATLAPYAEKDLDDTLDMLIGAGARYDRRQLGPAGLKAWEVRNRKKLKIIYINMYRVARTPTRAGVRSELCKISWLNSYSGWYAGLPSTERTLFAP